MIIKIFGRSVNPIPTWEGKLSPHITTGTPNVFHLPLSLDQRYLHARKGDCNGRSRLCPVMSTRVTVPVIIGNRCILMIGAFIDPFLNRFALSKCQSLPIPQNQRIFPSNSRKPKSLPVIIGNHCILMIGAFIDPFLNRFAFSKCRSLPIPPNQRIFPSNSRKPKSLPEIICG